MNIDFSSWNETKKPDKNYGMSCPYVTIKLNNKTILEKFPFSPYMGKNNKASCLIADISSLSKKEFSVQIYKDDKRINFQRNFETLQSAYEWFLENS